MKIKIIFLILFINSLFVFGQEYNRLHSVGVDFGTTIFTTVTIPLITDNVFKPKDGASGKVYDGKYGIRFSYNYAYLPNQAIDITLGVYGFDTHYGNNTPETNSLGSIIASGISSDFHNGSVVALPASIGVRFYTGNKPNGFFLLPKVGMTSFIINAKDVNSSGDVSYKTTSVFDFYIAGEMGFKIDLFENSDWPVAPFIDISLLDIGYSFTHMLRIVPLPRLAIGLYF